ncbi:hypothetical protein ACWDR3_18605 [Streptomyces sp. NPDC001002]
MRHPTGRRQYVIAVLAAAALPTKDSRLGVAAVWDLAGDLRSMSCTATADAPGYARFLRACAGLDFPGNDPAAAATWLERTTPLVDKAFAKAGAPIDSPLLRSGTTATYLQESALSKAANTYMVYVFGAPES